MPKFSKLEMLAIYGVFDHQLLTSNPEFTFFKVSYRRHDDSREIPSREIPPIESLMSPSKKYNKKNNNYQNNKNK